SVWTSFYRVSDRVLNGLNKREVVEMVAIDLKRAFDTVDHAIILEKLDYYSVR
ncbi:hypothetical protein CAPTEDRAFT_29261, partial [Capitella teleta]